MKLSIIIPVYNTSTFLESNFSKLLPVYELLSEKDFEIIYVNDGSTDDSGDILERLKKQKTNITVIHQDNQGSSGARNSGIDIAKGKYIQFLDSDDYIDWDKIISLLDLAIKENLDAICYRLDTRDTDFNLLKLGAKHPVPFDKIITGADALISGYAPSSICVFLFKTEFLNTNKLRITPKITHMDVEFTSRMMLVCNKLMFKDIIAYHYIRRDGSITKPTTIEKRKKLLSDEVFVANVIKGTLKKEYSTELKNAIKKNYNSVVWNLLWHFYQNPNQVDIEFKKSLISELKEKKLYPIKGPLKTRFQNTSRILMNIPFILNFFINKK